MKKFMKITVGIVAKLAFFAIVCATAYGVAHLWDTTGLYVLLGAVLLVWIISGFFPDKQARAYAEMQIKLGVMSDEVKRSRKEYENILRESETLDANLKAAKVALEDALAEYEVSNADMLKFKTAWEEATKREEMLHKQLREKQGKVEYWRNKYDALKEEFEAYKAGELVRDGITLTTADDVEREGAVEVAVAEAKSEEVNVEVASVPAPAPRRHKIKRQIPKPAKSCHEETMNPEKPHDDGEVSNTNK